MVEVGERAAAARVFTSPFESVTVHELAAEHPILLFFYLFDWSSTCTDEMALFGDRSEELRVAGVELYGISRDSPWTHIAWQQALDLNFALLSDWNGEATRAFGIAHEFRAFRDVAQRSAFIVDRDGIVQFARRYSDDELPDLDEIAAAARRL